MIALVDCNNFFASCERLFRPELANKPVAVLSNNDGCIVARSNEVKALGIPMGAPHFQVRDILEKNKVTLFSSNFALYSNISQRILEELRAFSPRLEVYSIDEAFMDLSQLPIQHYDEWGTMLKKRVQKHIGIPVSVGIAPTKTLAKLASDWSKRHEGVCLLNPKLSSKTYQEVLKSSDVSDIWGIGRVLSRKIHAAGIHSAWQLSQTSEHWLHDMMGVNGLRLHKELNGVPVHTFEDEKKPQKSILASRSFGHHVRSQYELESAVASFAAQAAARLRKFSQTAELFGVFLRYKNEEGQNSYLNGAVRMMPCSNDTAELTSTALNILNTLYLPEVVYKKAGVYAYNLSPARREQQALFDKKTEDERAKQKRLMRSIDAINARFGASKIQLATIDPKYRAWPGKKNLMSPTYTTSWSELPRVSA